MDKRKEKNIGTLPDLDGQEFYDLMQQYRMAPMTDQKLVTKCFEDVKSYLKNKLIDENNS